MDDQTPPEEAKNLAFLRRLVTVLTSVMIAGVVLIVVLLAIRLTAPVPAPFPDNLALPEDAVPVAITRGPDFLLVVTEDGRAFILDPAGEGIRQEIILTPAE
ncbi:MAG: DUF6476 family protein [Pseudomonadota bacterium]